MIPGIYFPTYSCLIQYEVRPAGAIGEFTPKWFYVRADGLARALSWVLDDIHVNGYESRGFCAAKLLRGQL